MLWRFERAPRKECSASDRGEFSGRSLKPLDVPNESVGKQYVAKASTIINAPIAKVWDALVNPDIIRQYMFGTDVVSDWKSGTPIIWKGEWKGKKYEDRGTILRLEPEHVISYSHFSPLSGLPDAPENYHTVTVELSRTGNGTVVSLSQDKSPTEDARKHSEENWGMMLASLKKLLENQNR